MILFDLFDKAKNWFYSIPVIDWLRRLHHRIHMWNRYVGFFVNWIVAHGGVTALVASAGALVGLAIGHVWLAAFVAAVGMWAVYLIGELAGVFRKGTSPWWDHVGDMVGPSLVVLAVWLLR